MILWEIRPGNYHIVALGSETECQVIDFIRKLGCDDPAEYAKVNARLDWVAENGPPHNKELNRALGNGCFELKTANTRIGYFWERGRMIVCEIAFSKKGQKTPKRILKQLVAMKRNYENGNQS